MERFDVLPATATLKNGVEVTLRLLRADDRERMDRAVRGLDPQSIYTRLFAHRKDLTEAGLDRIMRTDGASEIVIVATTGRGDEEAIVGGGRYVVTGEGRAEVAFTVEEDYQGLGIAGRLFAALLDVARGNGITVLEADVLSENPSMLRVFERTGLPMRKRAEGGTVHLELTLAG